MFVPATTPYPAEIRPLTALRFFAAAVVVLFHFTLVLPFAAADYSGLFAKGYLAVDFFFILSGFILSHVYLAAAEEGKLSTIGFYGRRLARVYPVHLFALFVALSPYIVAVLGGLPELIPDNFSLRYVLSSAFLVHAWGFDDRPVLNVPSWSISAEWFAYLLFPLLAVGMKRIGVRTMLALAAALFCAVFICVSLLPDDGGALLSERQLTDRTFDFGIMRIVPEFILGMALYRFGRAWQWRGSSRPALAICFLLLAGLLQFAAPDIMIVLVFAVLILLVAEGARQGRASVLDRPALVLLGELSYSLYMLHYLWLDLVFTVGLKGIYGDAIPAAVLYPCWLALFPLSLLTAAWCYRAVEQPGRRGLWAFWQRHFMDRNG